MVRYINMCLIFVGMSILCVGLPTLVNAEEKCEVIADKLVKPDDKQNGHTCQQRQFCPVSLLARLFHIRVFFSGAIQRVSKCLA